MGSCPNTDVDPKKKSILIRNTAKSLYNKSFIDQACSVEMAGY